MGILEKINTSDDVKALKAEELEPLCQEIRSFLIESISHTGGHLASNLGAVELTVALHRVYDTSRDRVVFDVGHQGYTHKILTGRRDKFSTLRQYGGLSGFLKPYESDDDAFISGHASNSISVAMGMARARTINGDDYNVAAVIGDGAMTGGLAYEGLEDAAGSDEPIVIILNDNKMSISKNVGGMSRALAKMRYRSAYISFKKAYRAIFKKIPILYNINHALKEKLKETVLPTNTFVEMGFEYLGPVDGHNVHELEKALSLAKDMDDRVIVHVVTTKGKGCSYAMEHPDKYHGVGKFNAQTGEIYGGGETFSSVFGETMCRLAEEDRRVFAITAAMSSGTGLTEFEKKFPERFADIGIAEGHATAMAAGMAKQGAIPVFAVYSSFLQRAYDMLIHDVSLQKLHVVFAVDRAGLVGSDGETHNGVFDVDYIGSVPGMTILCPSSFAELRMMLERAVLEETGPVAVRYPRGGEGEFRECCTGNETLIRKGNDITVAVYGTMINEAIKAADALDKKGISAEIVKLNVLKPTDLALTMASLKKTGRLLISEDVCAVGSAGRFILAKAYENGVAIHSARLLNLGEGIVPHGTVEELMREFRVDAQAMIDAAEEMMR
ncbi:MAG: 1-deoxy-D-xylulose-5-phosphate synthase [Eubacteriales bacterium]|nr:1-deoxy-D-xylulose-5-phosphate synthase [Eubacteriales bacterium]